MNITSRIAKSVLLAATVAIAITAVPAAGGATAQAERPHKAILAIL